MVELRNQFIPKAHPVADHRSKLATHVDELLQTCFGRGFDSRHLHQIQSYENMRDSEMSTM